MTTAIHGGKGLPLAADAGTSSGNPRHSRCVYVVLLIGLFASATLLERWLDTRIEEERHQGRVLARGRLAAVAWTLAERSRAIDGFRRDLAGIDGAAWTRAVLSGEGERVKRALAAVLPEAGVWLFDAAGRLVETNRSGPRRERELLWAGMLEAHRSPLDVDRSPVVRAAANVCRRLFGGLTLVSDLGGAFADAVWVNDRGRSLLVRAMLLQAGPGQTKAGALIIAAPTANGARRLAAAAVREAPAWVDAAAVMRPTVHGWRCVARRGSTMIGRGALSRMAMPVEHDEEDSATGRRVLTLRPLERGVDDRWGIWHGVYVPDERGSFLVVGQSHQRFDGVVGRHRRLLELLHLLVVVLVAGFAFRVLWLGRPVDLGISAQIFGMFALLTVLPIGLVIIDAVDGLATARDDAWREAERRLAGEIMTLEKDAEVFVADRHARIASCEAALGEHIAAALERRDPLDLTPWFRRFAVGLGAFEALVFDAAGRRHVVNVGGRVSHPAGEYACLFARYVAGWLEFSGVTPPPALASAPLLFSAKEADELGASLFWERPALTRGMLQGNTILVRARRLKADPTGLRTVGGISWRFDPASLLAPFVRVSHSSRRPADEADEPVRLGFVRADGRWFPPVFSRSRAAQALGESVRRTQAPATGLARDDTGCPMLLHIRPPRICDGYYPVAWLPVGEVGQRRVEAPPAAVWLGMRTPSALMRNQVRTVQLLALAVIGSIAFMLPAAILLSRWFVGRVVGLQAMVRAIGRGDYAARLAALADDELGRLAEAFNLMAAGLDERQRMQQFVSDRVLSEVKKDDDESLALGGSRMQAAVLFSHVHDFDALAATLDPERLVSFLNAYFTEMDEAIRAHGGMIDKLIGDAVMAVFFADGAAEGHPAARALAAAAEMLQRQRQLQAAAATTGLPATRTDVGVHCGPVVSGKVGSRHGLIDFTVIGDTVNAAARLQSYAATRAVASIAVSAEVYQRRPQNMSMTEVEAVRLKGKARALRVFVKEMP